MSDDMGILTAIEMQAEQMRSAYRLEPLVLPEAILPDRWASRMVEAYGSLEAAGDAIGVVLRRYSDVYGVPEEEEADE